MKTEKRGHFTADFWGFFFKNICPRKTKQKKPNKTYEWNKCINEKTSNCEKPNKTVKISVL